MVKQVIRLKMHPTPNQQLVLFIQATILSIYFPTFLCNGPISYSAWLPYCSGEPFDCGSIKYISYPFWGGSRKKECGHEGFELVCQAGVPMLTISSLSYRVQQIDFDTNTLKVARADLQNNTCPEILHNTTIDHHLFKYPPSSHDKNATLYFDCTSDQHQLETLPNKFTCDVKGAETINLFKTGDASSGPGPDITCNNNIFVPINQEAAQSLENPSASSINMLQSALASGFSIQWFNDSKQYYAPFCSRRGASYYKCRPAPSPGTYYTRRCYNKSCNPPSAVPEEPQGGGRICRGGRWSSGRQQQAAVAAVEERR